MADLLREASRMRASRCWKRPRPTSFSPILTDVQCAALRTHMAFQDWERVDGVHRAVRFVTSWATREETAREAAAFIRAL